MSNRYFFTGSNTTITLDKIEFNELSPNIELIDEVKEGLQGFLFLIAICDILPYVILSIALLFLFPLVVPVIFIQILFLMNQSLKKCQKLEQIFPQSRSIDPI
jgi:hypothetical protein